jgi:hypothetical protein
MDRNFATAPVCANKKKKKCHVKRFHGNNYRKFCQVSGEGSGGWNWVWRNKVCLRLPKSGGGGVEAKILPATFISVLAARAQVERVSEREKDEIWNSGPRNLCPIGDRLSAALPLFSQPNSSRMPCRGVKDDTEQQPRRDVGKRRRFFCALALCGPWARCARRSGECRRRRRVTIIHQHAFFYFTTTLRYFHWKARQHARSSLAYTLINYAARLKVTTRTVFFSALEKPRVDSLL